MQDETECIVCFSRYDGEEHRPRSLPCGHTLCSECLKTSIRERTRKCPKCRANYSASNVNALPINFCLESVLKLLNNKVSDLPKCIEHQLLIIHRCSTHKMWVCQRCIQESHSLESCKMITICEELRTKKSTQLKKSQILLNRFEEKCRKSDNCKKQHRKEIKEVEEAITRYETMIKRLQGEVKIKKNMKTQMENRFATFNQKVEIMKNKRKSYDKAVSTLKSSESIIQVSRFSDVVQNEAEKLILISYQIEKELDNFQLNVMQQDLKVAHEHYFGNHNLSVRNGIHHLHALQGSNTSKSASCNIKFIGENESLVTDGITTFLDITWPGQAPQRVYIKMIENSARARQHLLLVTGHYGYSYKELLFYSPNDQSQPGECIIIRPYDGDKAAPLLKDITVNDVDNRQTKAGLMSSAGWNEDYNNGLFSIYLRDIPGKQSTGFGLVTSGLEVLQEAAKSNGKDNIKIVDCGVVLFW